MPIIELQRRLHEIGRIRIGEQRPTSSGKTRPAKLDAFRLTSRDQRAIDSVAAVYGGTPQKWTAPDGSGQWEVYTPTAEMPVTVPPSEMAFSQWFELWSAGGCKRRCDGQHEVIGDQPCLCNPNERECDIHTRLSVILREIPGLGVWRLDTQGWYAATELRGSVEVLSATMSAGKMLPARLRLEQRSVTRQGQPRRDFAVPVLDVDVTFDALQAIATTGVQELPPNPQAALSTADGHPQEEPPPIAPQAPQRAPQRRRAPVLPSTGIRPRTAAEVKATGDEQQSGDAQRKRFFAAFGQHRIRGLDRLLITNQIIGHTTPGREVQTSDDLTSGERSNIIDVLERLLVSEDEEDFSAFSRRLDRAMTTPNDADIDPETGELVPDLNQPTLNGDTT